ncbi:hypothetical protein BZG36_02707 [Bifiguratus adelaidae]|uniref:Pre-mRNA-processing protein 45 n=1 Tax=Bifiguratus adelaidae TaxID=1938954 RepID=A0A261Y231_9FUNG|nr:hypothetical protein BZG36_02707 [Bifiguratus adelaidae]
MATALSGILPKPRFEAHLPVDLDDEREQSQQLVSKSQIPPYGARVGWTPRTLDDYGNGGAFPEIHTAQYPLDMGRAKTKGSAPTQGGALTLEVDGEGNIKYDKIARQGHEDDKIIQSQFKDIVPLRERADINDDEESNDRPDEETVMSTAERTRLALQSIVNGKIAAARPNSIAGGTAAGNNQKPTYIRYTPAGGQSDGFNSGAKQRIIRMTEAPVDPFDPPKFKHKKVPRGPPSPPAPVLHSPPRKVTAKEQAEWVIPPCISNWKNNKGYTIPLDKRLAADGRGLQEVTINDNFAKLSEALYAADRHAREEVRQRNLMQQKVAQKQKEAEEEKMRQIAQRAREERAGITSSAADRSSGLVPPSNRPTAAEMMSKSLGGYGSESEEESDDEDDEAASQREEIRREKAKQRERELRMSRMGAETKAKALLREQGRDISEKIALGLAKPTQSSDSMFDSRLYNQSEGMSSGFKDDEAYNLYDKPLFNGSSMSSIYRPKANADSEAYGGGSAEQIEQMVSSAKDKFGMSGGSKGFAGTDGGRDVRREGPVEFEKEVQGGSAAPKADPFGVDSFLSQAKKGKRAHHDYGSVEKKRRQ